MAGTGGARPGAGRKPKIEKYKSEHEQAEQWIGKRLTRLLKKQYELAMGVTVQDTDPKTGGLIVYTEKPDRAAGQYLINRVLGTPTQVQAVGYTKMTDDELINFIQTETGSNSGSETSGS